MNDRICAAGSSVSWICLNETSQVVATACRDSLYRVRSGNSRLNRLIASLSESRRSERYFDIGVRFLLIYAAACEIASGRNVSVRNSSTTPLSSARMSFGSSLCRKSLASRSLISSSSTTSSSATACATSLERVVNRMRPLVFCGR